jgi:hypothetical protein
MSKVKWGIILHQFFKHQQVGCLYFSVFTISCWWPSSGSAPFDGLSLIQQRKGLMLPKKNGRALRGRCRPRHVCCSSGHHHRLKRQLLYCFLYNFVGSVPGHHDNLVCVCVQNIGIFVVLLGKKLPIKTYKHLIYTTSMIFFDKRLF